MNVVAVRPLDCLDLSCLKRAAEVSRPGGGGGLVLLNLHQRYIQLGIITSRRLEIHNREVCQLRGSHNGAHGRVAKKSRVVAQQPVAQSIHGRCHPIVIILGLPLVSLNPCANHHLTSCQPCKQIHMSTSFEYFVMVKPDHQ